MAQRYLDQGVLKRVEQVPAFSYPVSRVYPHAAESPALQRAVALLREAAEEEYDWSRWNYEIQPGKSRQNARTATIQLLSRFIQFW